MRKASRHIDGRVGAELPQPDPGAAWTGPVSPVALELPEELRQRIQAAVESELIEAAADDRERIPEDWTTGRTGRDRLTELVASKEAGLEQSGALADGATPGKPRRRIAAGLIALGLAALLIAVGSLAAVAANGHSPSPATARAQAAAWVAEQVSPGVTVSCDAAMCAALQAHGFPAGKLVVLGPTTPDPPPSVLVIETAAVRELLGRSLAMAWAPTVLASFGSGTDAITVRVVAPHGATAYRAALIADLAGRKTSGDELLYHSQVTVSATARSQLLAGQVDLRLLLALASVAGREPINIVRFGYLGPGASPGVPLNFADLAESIPAARKDVGAYARAVWAVLEGDDARIRPERALYGSIQGQVIFRVEFASPSPLGNLGSGSP
jgi:hypothetical protein